MDDPHTTQPRLGDLLSPEDFARLHIKGDITHALRVVSRTMHQDHDLFRCVHSQVLMPQATGTLFGT